MDEVAPAPNLPLAADPAGASAEALPAEPPPLAEAASRPPPAPEPPAMRFRFHGDARGYFRIWIVNVLLTILTLGVYAAWAKVRRRRYFRGNLDLGGHRFDYTAKPWRLMIGNVIMVAVFLGYAMFGSVYPWVRLVTILVGLCALPWVIVRSLAFNAHHTVYRGLRFRFQPSLGAAAGAYLGMGFVAGITFFLCYPLYTRAKREFQVSRHRYGTGYFRFAAPGELFYGAYWLAFLAVFGALGVLVACTIRLQQGHFPTGEVFRYAPTGFYFLVIFFARQYAHAKLFNVVWNGTRLDESRFVATMQPGYWLRLQLVNWAAIVATGGLLYPWATMRSARYTASCLTFHPTRDFLALRKFGESDGSAIGDSAAEFVGLDFGL